MPETTVLPSAVTLTAVTWPVWPINWRTTSPFSKFQTSMDHAHGQSHVKTSSYVSVAASLGSRQAGACRANRKRLNDCHRWRRHSWRGPCAPRAPVAAYKSFDIDRLRQTRRIRSTYNTNCTTFIDRDASANINNIVYTTAVVMIKYRITACTQS